jgi:spermidine synthase
VPALQGQDPGRLGLARLLLAAAAAGLCAQTAEAIALREVLEVARGGEAVLGLALAAWLLGGALGALTWRGPALGAAALALLLPLLLVPLLRLLPVSPSGFSPLASLVALPVAYGPAAFFATVLRRAPARGAIGLEAVGAGIAGVLLSLVLLETVPALLLVAGAGGLCLLAEARGRQRLVLLLLLLVSLAYGVARCDGPLLERRARGIWPGSEPVRIVESPYGRLLWLRRGDQRALFVGGQLSLTVPDDVEAEAFVNVVLAAHPDPRRVLVLGPGLAGVLRECLRHPVETLEVAIPDERILSILRDDLPEADREALERAQVRIGDPRRIAAEAPRDVILSLSPAPLTLSSNRAFTREFFASLRLAPDGFVAFSLPAAPNEREGAVMARNVSVFRALAPLEAVVLPGTDDLFLAGAKAPDVSPETLSKRLAERGIALRHHAPDFFAEDFAPAEVARVTAAYKGYPARPAPAVPFAVAPRDPQASPPKAPADEDLHPAAVLLSAAALAREADAPLLRTATRLAPFSWILLLALAGLGAVLARRRDAAPALSAATSGAAAMGLWTTALLVYQARVGALYGDLALLAAAFMAGLALGARVRARLVAVDLAFVVVAMLVLAALPFAGRWTAVGLAIAVGAAGGATLVAAAAARPGKASRLYAWDLLGAAVAAVVFGTFLLPAVGAVGACATAAGVKLLSFAGGVRSGSR